MLPLLRREAAVALLRPHTLLEASQPSRFTRSLWTPTATSSSSIFAPRVPSCALVLGTSPCLYVPCRSFAKGVRASKETKKAPKNKKGGKKGGDGKIELTGNFDLTEEDAAMMRFQEAMRRSLQEIQVLFRAPFLSAFLFQPSPSCVGLYV